MTDIEKLALSSEMANKFGRNHNYEVIDINENQIEELSFHPNGNCGCILLYDDYAFGIRCSHLMWSEGHCEGIEGFWSEDDHTLAQERYNHNDYNSSYNSIFVYGNHKGNLVIKMIVFHETTK